MDSVTEINYIFNNRPRTMTSSTQDEISFAFATRRKNFASSPTTNRELSTPHIPIDDNRHPGPRRGTSKKQILYTTIHPK